MLTATEEDEARLSFFYAMFAVTGILLIWIEPLCSFLTNVRGDLLFGTKSLLIGASLPFIQCWGFAYIIFASQIACLRDQLLTSWIWIHSIGLTLALIECARAACALFITFQFSGHDRSEYLKIGSLLLIFSLTLAALSVVAISYLIRLVRSQPVVTRSMWTVGTVCHWTIALLMFGISYRMHLQAEEIRHSEIVERRERIRSNQMNPAEAAHSGSVSAVAISPDGLQLATCCDEHPLNPVRIWNLQSGRIEQYIVSHRAENSLAWSPDGDLLIVGCGRTELGQRTGEILLYDTANKSIERITTSREVLAVAVSPDGRLLAAGYAKGYLGQESFTLFDVPSLEPIVSVEGDLTVTSIHFYPDGQRLLIGGEKVIQFWDMPVRSGDAPKGQIQFDQRVCSIDLNHRNDSVFAMLQNGKLKQILPNNQVGRDLLRHGGQSDSCIAVTPDGFRVVASSASNGIRIIEWQTGSTKTIGGIAGGKAISVSPDGTAVVTGGNHRVSMSDLMTGKILREFKPGNFEIRQ